MLKHLHAVGNVYYGELIDGRFFYADDEPFVLLLDADREVIGHMVGKDADRFLKNILNV